MNTNAIVSREEWLVARKDLLVREKAHTRARDQLNAQRQAMPWVRVDKDYRFDTPEGEKTLDALFDGRRQLVVNHFMLAPDWEAGCIGCSFGADHLDPAVVHLNQHDVTLVAVSRANLDNIEAYKSRMGWHFPWVSSGRSDFNYDFQVSFTREQLEAGMAAYNYAPMTADGFYEELHGFGVFIKGDGPEVYHSYSSYGRGMEEILTAFMVLDRVPLGRNERSTMDRVKRHDEYMDARMAPSSCCGNSTPR